VQPSHKQNHSTAKVAKGAKENQNLTIETGDVSFRLEQMREFLENNY
jgi:hypothetical protein